jgi:DNA-binding NarL/FixJ family response regulator
MKRIFIYSSRSLFSQGIKNLLDAEPGLEIVGWETDPEKALRCIGEVKPDVVLLVTRSTSTRLWLDGQRFLRAGVKAKIVEVSLDDSNVCVYRGEQQTVTQVGDLVRIIEQSFTVSPGLLHETRPPEEMGEDGGQ